MRSIEAGEPVCHRIVVGFASSPLKSHLLSRHGVLRGADHSQAFAILRCRQGCDLWCSARAETQPAWISCRLLKSDPFHLDSACSGWHSQTADAYRNCWMTDELSTYSNMPEACNTDAQKSLSGLAGAMARASSALLQECSA